MTQDEALGFAANILRTISAHTPPGESHSALEAARMLDRYREYGLDYPVPLPPEVINGTTEMPYPR